MCLVSATQRIRVSLTALSPPHASGKFHDVRLVARTHAAARLPLFLMASSLGALAAALRDSLRRGRLQREQDTLDQEYVPHYADTYCAYRLRVPASCVQYVPKAQSSLLRVEHYRTCAVRVPASGVPCVPRTVWCTAGLQSYGTPADSDLTVYSDLTVCLYRVVHRRPAVTAARAGQRELRRLRRERGLRQARAREDDAHRQPPRAPRGGAALRRCRGEHTSLILASYQPRTSLTLASH